MAGGVRRRAGRCRPAGRGGGLRPGLEQRRGLRPGRLRRSAGWLLLCAAAAGGALLAGAADPAALRWQPGLALTEPWRAVSAAWVHLSRQHLLANLAGCALVAALGAVAGCGARAAAAWALAWPLTHLALALQPALASYGGLSGLLHAGVAVAAWQLLRAGRPPAPAAVCSTAAGTRRCDHDGADDTAAGSGRWIGAALLAGLALKLLGEAPWQGPLRQVPGWDIPIAPLAHASGALAGLLCALACGVGRASRPPSSTDHRTAR